MTKPAGRSRRTDRIWQQGRIRPGERLRCNACNGKFRVTHGTPFEGTHLPLQK
jgi:hypothetical protein